MEMSQERRSERERLLDVERQLSEVRGSLDQLNTSMSALRTAAPIRGLDVIQLKGFPGQAALFEQALSLLRSLYLTPFLMAPPPPPEDTATLVCDCTKVVFTDPRIEVGMGIYFELLDATMTPFDSTEPGAAPGTDCLTISTELVIDGRAEITICCKGRPCPKKTFTARARRPDPAGGATTVGVIDLEFGCR
jgi:hypothetical protein